MDLTMHARCFIMERRKRPRTTPALADLPINVIVSVVATYTRPACGEHSSIQGVHDWRLCAALPFANAGRLRCIHLPHHAMPVLA